MPAKFFRKYGGLPAVIEQPEGGDFEFSEGRPPSRSPITVRTPAQVVFPGQEEEALEAQFQVLPDDTVSPTFTPPQADIPGTGDGETPLSRKQRRFQGKQQRLDVKAQREELKADQAELRHSHQTRIDAARERRREVEGPPRSERIGEVAKKSGLAVVKGGGIAAKFGGGLAGTTAGGIGRGISGVAKYGFKRHEEGRTQRSQIQLIQARNTRLPGPGMQGSISPTRLPGPGTTGGLRSGVRTPALMRSNVAPKLMGGAYRGPAPQVGGATPSVPVQTLPT